MTVSKKNSSRARTSARRARARPRPYHHGSLRASLLEAADAVLSERGAHGITLREVARAAGVSHGAPYHHFANLEELLAAVAERGFLILGDAMEKAVSGPDPRERLVCVTQTYVACARAHPARFRLMFGPLLASQDRHPSLRDAAHRAFGFVFAASHAHDERHGAILSLAGWSLAHGLSHLWIDGAFQDLPIKKQNPDDLARKLSERLLGSSVQVAAAWPPGEKELGALHSLLTVLGPVRRPKAGGDFEA